MGQTLGPVALQCAVHSEGMHTELNLNDHVFFSVLDSSQQKYPNKTTAATERIAIWKGEARRIHW
jgi:hypothetical protein